MSILPEQEIIWVNHNFQPDNKSWPDQAECPHYEIILLAAQLVGEDLRKIEKTDRFCGKDVTYKSRLFVYDQDIVFTTCEDLTTKLLFQLSIVDTEVEITVEEVIKNLTADESTSLKDLQQMLKSQLGAVNHKLTRDSIIDRWREVMYEVATIGNGELSAIIGNSVSIHFKEVDSPRELTDENVISWSRSIFESLKSQTGFNCTQRPR